VILKDRDKKNDSQTKFNIAGAKAEEQMIHYLQRAFADKDDIVVLNDIRIQDDNGEIAQMDHLVIHEFGFIVVESKSVTTKVSINEYGEWVRYFNNKPSGMRSPIKQAQMQTDILKKILEVNKDRLFKQTLINKLIKTSFDDYPFEVLVAISDTGIIKRPKNYDTSMVLKADQICDVINEKINSYRKKSKSLVPIGTVPSAFYKTTMLVIAEFLKSKHKPIEVSSKEIDTLDHKTIKFVCKKCKSDNLNIVWGKYGYYFKCSDCQGNTAIHLKCKDEKCKVKLKKEKNTFYQVCETCNTKNIYFVNKE